MKSFYQPGWTKRHRATRGETEAPLCRFSLKAFAYEAAVRLRCCRHRLVMLALGRRPARDFAVELNSITPDGLRSLVGPAIAEHRTAGRRKHLKRFDQAECMTVLEFFGGAT